MKIEIDIPDDELSYCVSCGSGEMTLTLNVNETIDGYDITSVVSDTYDGNASLKYREIKERSKTYKRKNKVSKTDASTAWDPGRPLTVDEAYYYYK